MYPEPKVTIYQYELDDYKKSKEKLKALEDHGVANWEYHDYALRHWKYKYERVDLFDEVIQDVNDLLTEADVDQPAGYGCGYAISFDEPQLKKFLEKFLEKYKNWESNAPAN